MTRTAPPPKKKNTSQDKKKLNKTRRQKQNRDKGLKQKQAKKGEEKQDEKKTLQNKKQKTKSKQDKKIKQNKTKKRLVFPFIFNAAVLKSGPDWTNTIPSPRPYFPALRGSCQSTLLLLCCYSVLLKYLQKAYYNFTFIVIQVLCVKTS